MAPSRVAIGMALLAVILERQPRSSWRGAQYGNLPKDVDGLPGSVRRLALAVKLLPCSLSRRFFGSEHINDSVGVDEHFISCASR